MWSLILGLALKAGEFFLGLVPKAKPVAQQLGDAETTNASLEAENAILKQTAAANVAASVDSVRSDPAAAVVDTNPADHVNQLPGEVWR